jgi:hypothetical protein
MDRFSWGRFLKGIPLQFQVLLVIGTAVVAFALLQFGLPSLAKPAQATTALTTGAGTTRPPTSGGAQVPTVPSSSLSTPTPRPTPTLLAPEGGIIYAVQPRANRVGWIVSGLAGNHFGDSYLYTGVLDGKIHHGAFQFDLSFLSPGSSVVYAAVELVGLDDQRVGTSGQWSLEMLGTEVDPEWPLHGYEQIHGASTTYTLSPVLDRADLAKGKENVFVLSQEQREELQRRVSRGVVSFRLDGPTSGPDNLFAWDSGYGPDSLGKAPTLRLAIAPRPAAITPAAPRIGGWETPTYVVITSVPKPGNLLTAAAVSLTATAWATVVGTPTPLPPNWATPIIVTATPTPANEATATSEAMMATAGAVLTGTPTPTPGNVWTATPTPTYVVVTPSPTPDNVLTVAAHALTVTAWATITGTLTPLPANWVTPIIVTATPQPRNGVTATAQAMDATAQVIVVGTPTPTPPNLWVVVPSPTPVYVYVRDLPTTEPQTPTPSSLPLALAGKIAFMSTRRGTPSAFVMDTNGGGVAWLTGEWVYGFALARQVVAPDNRDAYLSPDGRSILYHVGQPGARQVWIANADGSSPRNLSNNVFDEYSPVWLRSAAPTPTFTPTPGPPTPTPTSGPPPPPRATPRPKPTPPI